MCLVTRLGQEHQLELFHLYQVVLTLGTGNVLMRLHESILSMPHATHLVQCCAVWMMWRQERVPSLTIWLVPRNSNTNCGQQRQGQQQQTKGRTNKPTIATRPAGPVEQANCPSSSSSPSGMGMTWSNQTGGEELRSWNPLTKKKGPAFSKTWYVCIIFRLNTSLSEMAPKLNLVWSSWKA